MTEKTADCVVEFIDETRSKDRIKLVRTILNIAVSSDKSKRTNYCGMR